MSPRLQNRGNLGAEEESGRYVRSGTLVLNLTYWDLVLPNSTVANCTRVNAQIGLERCQCSGTEERAEGAKGLSWM